MCICSCRHSKEASLAIEVLKNLYMALRAYLEGRIKVDFEKGETLYRWRDKKKKNHWYCAAVPWPEAFPFAMDTYEIDNEDFLADMNAAKKTEQTLELDWFYFPLSALSRRKEASRYPLCFCAADADAGQIIDGKMLGRNDDPIDFVLGFLEAWIQENGRPAKILMRGVVTGLYLLDFCQKTDIALEIEGTPLIDQYIHGMMKHLEYMFDEENDDL